MSYKHEHNDLNFVPVSRSPKLFEMSCFKIAFQVLDLSTNQFDLSGTLVAG